MRLTPRLDLALQVAAVAHRDQVRKHSGAPYIVHPMAVSMLVDDHIDDEDVVIAALLHDVLEDVPADVYSAEEMRRDFGDRVVDLVHTVSEDKRPDMPRSPWRERKEGYLRRIAEHPDNGAVIIAAADKIHNLEATLRELRVAGDRVWESFNAGPVEQLWYSRSVCELVESRLGRGPLTRRLGAAVDELETLVVAAVPGGETR